MGDFNQYKENSIKNSYKLKQVVQKPTRKQAVLDKICTNMSNFYTNVDVIPQIGRSDHRVVLFLPDLITDFQFPHKVTRKSRSNGSNERAMFSLALSKTRWEPLYRLNDARDQLTMFTDSIVQLLD